MAAKPKKAAAPAANKVVVTPKNVQLGVGPSSLIQVVISGWNAYRTRVSGGVRPGLQPLVPRFDNDLGGATVFELKTQPGPPPVLTFQIPRGGEAFWQTQPWTGSFNLVLEITQEVPAGNIARGLVGVAFTLPLEGKALTEKLTDAAIKAGGFGLSDLDPLTGHWRAVVEFKVS